MTSSACPLWRSECNGTVATVETPSYKLVLRLPPCASSLFLKTSGRRFNFIAGGDCRCDEKLDMSSESSPWSMEISAHGTAVFRRGERSVLWRAKYFSVRAESDSIAFFHDLEGEGALDEVRFFRHSWDGNEYGFAGDVDEVYSGAPNFREQNFYHPAARVVISHGNDLGPDTGGHALASVPHVMALRDRRDTALLGCAVLAQVGEYQWDEMIWNPPVLRPPSDYAGDWAQAGGFAVAYHGKKHVRGAWRSPQLVMTFPGTVGEVLPAALEYAYRRALLPRPGAHCTPAWYYEPIYCPWHDQCALSHRDLPDLHCDMEPAADFAAESWTDRWLELLERQNIRPGTVILDAKWQKSKNFADPDPAKWPDLRRWIDRCHARGLRVLLWYAAWHNEDILPGEAITRDGKVVCGDITNPAYEKRLREMVRRYVSDEPDALNADGIKVDGLLDLPTGRGLENDAGIWGLELQRLLLKIIWTELNIHTKDACLSTFSAHPYLDEFSDMIRLGDMYTNRLSPVQTMLDRAQVVHVAHPDVPVDTDGLLYFHQGEDYMDDFPRQLECGIPTLYSAEYLRTGRFFFEAGFHRLRDEDYAVIRTVFEQFRKNRAPGSCAESR